MENNVTPIHDPYRRCDEVCTHDLARAVVVADLLSQDGTYPDAHPLLVFRSFPARTERTEAPVAAAG